MSCNILKMSTETSHVTRHVTRIVSYKAEGIVLCTATISACVFIAVGNISTIILIAANIILRKRTMFLVINMAFADLMLGTMSARILSVYSSDLAGCAY